MSLKRRDFFRLGLGGMAALGAGSCQTIPTSGPTGDTLLLAIDDHWLPFRHCLCYYISKPRVRPAPVLLPRSEDPTAPDRLSAHFYGTVLHDQGKFRMWYYAKDQEIPYGHAGYDKQSHVAYAESDDGIDWTRPSLGQVEFQGSRNNNLIALPGAKQYGACVIKEEEDPDPGRRYKMVFNPRGSGEPEVKLDLESLTPRRRSAAGRRRFRTATSADGIHWKAGPELPVEYFMEIGSFLRHGDYYIVHSQGIVHGAGEGGSKVGRQGFAWISPDFENWLEGYTEAFMLPEPPQPEKRGASHYDQAHLGVGGVSFGNVAVGLLGLWHERGWGAGGTSCDLSLLVSNDGMRFREPVKGHVFIASEESPATPVEGKDYHTLLCQYNGVLNVADETLIYHGRWRNDLSGYGEVALATLPRDRWGALGLFPHEPEGWVWSAPLVLPGDGGALSLNADQPDLISVELCDEHFKPISGFSGDHAAATVPGQGLESKVRWETGHLSRLGGETVRFRFLLRREDDREPRFYAAYLRST